MKFNLPYLKDLESESIYIIREAAASFRNPVFLYSIGKDSSALLHLINKAFYPEPMPFPLLHIDTGWKFKDMISFRDATVKRLNLNLIVYTNSVGYEEGISPFSHSSDIYTRIMKTDALRQALDKYNFDAAIGGARRDEERSRAKERVFSVRNGHNWEPRSQRPEFWNNFNTLLTQEQSMRIFPLSNWTEFDVWNYIALEEIPIVPLYFSKLRPVVFFKNNLIMVDDDRYPVGDHPVVCKNVRFRTLGCYPLTAAIESNARTVQEIIREVANSKFSERQGRLIDHDSESSMENKKKEGYF